MSDVTRVRDYMTTRVVTLAPDLDLHAAIRVLRKHHISGAPVVDATGAIVGVLSKRDCLQVLFRASYHQEHAGPVADYMSRHVETVDADARLVEVAERFVRGTFRRFPVTERGQLVGIVSRDDVLRFIVERR